MQSQRMKVQSNSIFEILLRFGTVLRHWFLVRYFVYFSLISFVPILKFVVSILLRGGLRLLLSLLLFYSNFFVYFGTCPIGCDGMNHGWPIGPSQAGLSKILNWIFLFCWVKLALHSCLPKYPHFREYPYFLDSHEHFWILIQQKVKRIYTFYLLNFLQVKTKM